MQLQVEGAGLPGVTDGIRFLQAVNLGTDVKVGKKVAVIGGGNTAIDWARTAKRLGGEEVRIVYRRSRAEMPAAREEIEALEKEGIKIDYLTLPLRFLSYGGILSGMECTLMKLGELDASGRLRPIAILGSEFTMPVDTVIAALGQVTQIEFLKTLGISFTETGIIEIDPRTGATNVEGIFAGGDVVTGAAYVIDAIAAGKKAAGSINRYLRGAAIDAIGKEKEPEPLAAKEVAALRQRFPPRRRVEMRELPCEMRIENFQEVTLGFDSREAIEEATRCLAGLVRGASPAASA